VRPRTALLTDARPGGLPHTRAGGRGLRSGRGCCCVGLPDWTKRGTARWLYKGKGGKDNPDNYRLTVLQPTLVKVLSFFLCDRLAATKSGVPGLVKVPERTVDLRLRELTGVQ
jgi:hypothetical protein